MELLTIQYIAEAAPRHIITACEDTDTCQSCGAGYKVGLSACEYCRTPVRRATGGLELRDMLALVHPGETIIPKAWA